MLARQETPQLDCPTTVEEATAILEDDIEDWIFVANDNDDGNEQVNPYTQGEELQ
jgi:uncharacterized protein YegJ (DUF2314 family)